MSDIFKDTALGRHSDYVDTYSPDVLFPVPRREARAGLGLAEGPLPFQGVDVWHAYELSWLDGRGKPHVAMAEFRVPCDSDNIIESKSFKLYLNSFANSRFADVADVEHTLRRDLSACAGAAIEVALLSLDKAAQQPWLETPRGELVDHLDVEIDQYDYDPALLAVDAGEVRSEQLASHLLRSRCPVTGQPDWATLIVHYQGPRIEPSSLLRYVVSLRNHQGFHEQVIERVFLDIQAQCQPAALSVYGRFTRRGGLDINPFRSTGETLAASLRTVRQ